MALSTSGISSHLSRSPRPFAFHCYVGCIVVSLSFDSFVGVSRFQYFTFSPLLHAFINEFKMRTILLLSLTLNLLCLLVQKVVAQDSSSSASSAPSVTSQPPASTSFVSQTPEMSASSVSSFFNALATSVPQQPGDDPAPGDAGSSAGAGDTDAGAAGSDSGSITVSRGGMIAIIVCVVFVVVFGITSSVLWYLAKKRSWEVRKTIRKSAKRVATALTPRRSTFPKDVQQQRRSTRGASKLDDVPPTPKIRSFDVEKGNPKVSSFEMSEPPKKSKWAAKLGR